MAAFSAKYCIFSSIVRVTSLPFTGEVNWDIVYGKSLLFLSSSVIFIPGTPDKYELYSSSTPVRPVPSILVLPSTCAKKLLLG